MLKGLQIANRCNYTKLQFEGDSHLVINMVQKLQHGITSSTISHNWRLESLIIELSQQL